MSDGDDKLVRRYRSLAREEPPPALDAAILAASRRAVASRPWSQRFAGPVSVAAVLVLALGITLNMQHQKPGVELPTASEYPVTPPPPPQPPAPATPGATILTPPLVRQATPEAPRPDPFTGSRALAPEARPEAIQAPASKPAPIPENFKDHALTERPKVTPEPSRPEPRAFAAPPVEAVTGPSPAAPSQPAASASASTNMEAAPASPASIAAAPASPARVAAAPRPAAPATIDLARPAAPASAITAPATVAPPPAFVPAPPSPGGPAAQSRPSPIEMETRIKPSVLAAPREKREAADSAAAGTAAPGVLAKSAPPLTEPAAELERIARLRTYGHHDQADKALEAFIRKYPDYRIPGPVWDRVKPR